MKKSFNIIKNNIDRSNLIQTDSQPLFSLIWLHGLGDTSEGFLDYFCLDQSPIHLGARIKLLQAPTRSVTINQGQ